MASARLCCLRGVGKSQGEPGELSSSAKSALVVDLVMGGSSSKRDERLSAKLFCLMGAGSSSGELPKRDIVTDQAKPNRRVEGKRFCYTATSSEAGLGRSTQLASGERHTVL